ncbi:MAG: hypothetical protein WDN46_23290 [Methylocella sp.]
MPDATTACDEAAGRSSTASCGSTNAGKTRSRPGLVDLSIVSLGFYSTNPRAKPPGTLQEQPVPSQPGSWSRHVFTEVAQ